MLKRLLNVEEDLKAVLMFKGQQTRRILSLSPLM